MSSSPITSDLVPTTVFYALLMGVLAFGLLVLRRAQRTAVPGTGPEPGTGARADGPAPPGTVPPGGAPGGRPWLRLIRYMAVSFAYTYLLLMAVVIAYYCGIARVGGNFIESAFTGCAELPGVSAPVFLALSWLAERRDRRCPTDRIMSACGRPGAGLPTAPGT